MPVITVQKSSYATVRPTAVMSQLTYLRSISCCDGWQLHLCEQAQWQALAALPALESLGEVQLVPPTPPPAGQQVATSQQQQQQQVVAVGAPGEQLQVDQGPATPGLQLQALMGLTALMEQARQQLPQLLEACPHLRQLDFSFNQGSLGPAVQMGAAAGAGCVVLTQLTCLRLQPSLVYASGPAVRRAEAQQRNSEVVAAAQVVVEEMLQYFPALQDLSFQWPMTHRGDSTGCRLPRLNALTGLTRLVIEVNDVDMGPVKPDLDDVVAMLAPLSQLRQVQLKDMTIHVSEDFDLGDWAAGSPLGRRLAKLGLLPHLENCPVYLTSKIGGLCYSRRSHYQTDSEAWSESEDSDSEEDWSSESDG